MIKSEPGRMEQVEKIIDNVTRRLAMSQEDVRAMKDDIDSFVFLNKQLQQTVDLLKADRQAAFDLQGKHLDRIKALEQHNALQSKQIEVLWGTIAELEGRLQAASAIRLELEGRLQAASALKHTVEMQGKTMKELVEENEELKSQYSEQSEHRDYCIAEFGDLSKANEELRKENEGLKASLSNGEFFRSNLSSHVHHLTKENKELKVEVDRLSGKVIAFLRVAAEVEG